MALTLSRTSSASSTSSTSSRSSNGHRDLSPAEASRLIRIARRKSSESSPRKDINLRIVLCHVHIVETLKQEYFDLDAAVEAEAEAEFEIVTARKLVASSPTAKGRGVRWMPPADLEDEYEDDGEEDFEALSLVRISSRSSDPPRAPL